MNDRLIIDGKEVNVGDYFVSVDGHENIEVEWIGDGVVWYKRCIEPQNECYLGNKTFDEFIDFITKLCL